MSRSDSDSWDLASSVGATATMVAAARQLELQYTDLSDVAAAPGAAEVLAVIADRGLLWAVVTSADDRLARARLGAAGNVYNYLDAGHHGWIGWDSNFAPTADLLYQVAVQSGSASSCRPTDGRWVAFTEPGPSSGRPPAAGAPAGRASLVRLA